MDIWDDLVFQTTHKDTGFVVYYAPILEVLNMKKIS